MSTPRTVDAVLFDFHFTLVRQRPARDWLADAQALADRDDDLEHTLPPDRFAELLAGLDDLWHHAAALDPDNERDLDAERHWEVFEELVGALPGLDAVLVAVLYATLLDVWTPYQDTLPALRALAAQGVRTAVISNVGIDIRPVLDRTGITPLVHAVLLSCEQGLVKPDPRLFERALEAVGVPAERALMVGDSWPDDGAATAVGMRALILPRGLGDGHGLDGVPRLVGSAD